MDEPTYQPIVGIRAVAVDGAENLLRQGEYYVADRRLVIKCPICRIDNLMPPSFVFSTGTWWQKLLGRNKGLLTQKAVCWMCGYGFCVSKGEIWTTTEPIKKDAIAKA